MTVTTNQDTPLAEPLRRLQDTLAKCGTADFLANDFRVAAQILFQTRLTPDIANEAAKNLEDWAQNHTDYYAVKSAAFMLQQIRFQRVTRDGQSIVGLEDAANRLTTILNARNDAPNGQIISRDGPIIGFR